ncbi:MAG: FmdB family zinc ribbon protein [Mycobacteriales bacterium]
MPTYTYACTACGEHLEVVQRFTDPALTECPACAGSLRKVFHPVGVVFKGSGFYKTDSRGKATATKDGAKRDTSAPAADRPDGKAPATPPASAGESAKPGGADTSSSSSTPASSTAAPAS